MLRIKIGKSTLLFLIIILLSIFLRFYKLEENLVFHGEIGHNALAIKNIILKGNIPLIGPQTSHPWLSFGPIYYWLMMPLFVLFDFDPRIGSYLFALIGVILVAINYIFVKKIFNLQIALISSFLIATLPIFLETAREARFFSLVLVIFYPFYYFLTKSLSEGKYFFWLGLTFGLFFSFHYSPLMFLPAMFFLSFKYHQKINFIKIRNLTLGLVIPNLSIIVNDLVNNGTMFVNLVLWIPYRVAGFLGIYPKNNITEDVLKENVVSIVSFFDSTVFPKIGSYQFIGTFIFLFGLLVILKTIKVVPISIKILFWLLISSLISLSIHTVPPPHYFLVTLPICVILLSIAIQILYEKYKIALFLVFVLISITNIQYLFSSKWFFKYLNNSETISYKTQLEVVSAIVNDAQNKPFSLKRVGEWDYFEDDYAQNYLYLMWYKGREPIKSADLTYTIYENFPVNEPLFFVNNVTVDKNEK